MAQEAGPKKRTFGKTDKGHKKGGDRKKDGKSFKKRDAKAAGKKFGKEENGQGAANENGPQRGF